MKEEYVPKPIEQPSAKSASQMANEAIRKAQEEDRMKLEIEKQAEALMEEARKRGQNPMDFMLHQQEILRYMEKNSDELVSFEDYEDLSPEEKLEIERQIHIERQIADGVAPEEVDTNVPEQYIPDELKGKAQDSANAAETPVSAEAPQETTFDEDVLRALSQQVLSENSDMIYAENENEDMVSLQEELFQNLKKMMAGSGVPVPQENVASLLSQAAANQMSAYDDDDSDEDTSAAVEDEEDTPVSAETPENGDGAEPEQEEEPAAPQEPVFTRKMSAVELAMAAQKGVKPGQEETEEEAQKESIEELDLSFDEMDDLFEETASAPEPVAETAPAVEQAEEAAEESLPEAETDEEASEAEPEDLTDDLVDDAEDEEYEYVDPDELVLGEHTQAEIDEALENLDSLGLDGEVYERAKRMLLLELAGSEAVLEAWLKEQEQSRKKKKADVSALDEDNLDDISDFDENLFEEELDLAIDRDFEEKDSASAEAAGEEEEEGIREDHGEGEDESDFTEDGEDGGTAGSGEETLPDHQDSEETVEEIPEEDTEKAAEADVEPEEGETEAEAEAEPEEAEAEVKTQETEPKTEPGKEPEERGYQISVRKPFILKNSTSFMDKLEDFITENQVNRRLSIGFKKLDSLLRFGLHKGSYFIDSQPQYLKNAFMQLIADHAAESGVDVLYISTELSRYDLMVDTLSRLSYEMNGHDPSKAHSVMSIMTGEDGATLAQLSDELNWFRGRISEHLFILDQEAVDEFIDSMEEEVSAGAILEELIRSIVTEGTHKPVVFIDNIENILSVEDSEDMKPLMEGIGKLAKELNIPIIMSYGYQQAENVEELSYEERLYHESLGNMCDVYLELKYAAMIMEDSHELTEDDIRDMTENGESILLDVLVYRNRRPMRASCQIHGTPKFNFFEEIE